MFDITIITGLASLFGCFCMFFVCAAQMRELFAAAQPATPHPWERDYASPPARQGFTAYEPGLATA